MTLRRNRVNPDHTTQPKKFPPKKPLSYFLKFKRPTGVKFVRSKMPIVKDEVKEHPSTPTVFFFFLYFLLINYFSRFKLNKNIHPTNLLLPLQRPRNQIPPSNSSSTFSHSKPLPQWLPASLLSLLRVSTQNFHSTTALLTLWALNSMRNHSQPQVFCLTNQIHQVLTRSLTSIRA